MIAYLYAYGKQKSLHYGTALIDANWKGCPLTKAINRGNGVFVTVI